MVNIKIRPAAKAAGSKSPTSATRKALEGKGQAMPGGRYPIPNLDFLKRAVRSIGRTPAAQRPAVVAWIKKRAQALGAPQLAANLSNAADYALELANSLDAVELSGAAAGSGEVQPQGGTKRKRVNLNSLKMPKQVNGSGASKKPPKSRPSGPLKTKEGKLNYAKLRAQGYDKNTALQAAKTHEQGMISGEWSNDHIDGTLELAGGIKFGSPQWDAKYGIKRFTKGGGKTPAVTGNSSKKLGLKSDKALQVYAKARKKGLPHPVALQAAKKCDAQAAEMAGSPKA